MGCQHAAEALSEALSAGYSVVPEDLARYSASSARRRHMPLVRDYGQAVCGRRRDDALAAEGIREEQRKFIKYNHLVANLLIFHKVVTMTKALEPLAADGLTWDEEIVALFTPYQTSLLNRFGRYAMNRDRVPESLDSLQEFRMPPRPQTVPQAAGRCVTIQRESLPGGVTA
jgi:hypothetical protein